MCFITALYDEKLSKLILIISNVVYVEVSNLLKKIEVYFVLDVKLSMPSH